MRYIAIHGAYSAFAPTRRQAIAGVLGQLEVDRIMQSEDIEEDE